VEKRGHDKRFSPKKTKRKSPGKGREKKKRVAPTQGNRPDPETRKTDVQKKTTRIEKNILLSSTGEKKGEGGVFSQYLGKKKTVKGD